MKSRLMPSMSVFIFTMVLLFVPGHGLKTHSRTVEESHGLRNRPLRVISLAPSITEILFALGAGDLIVGVTTWCDYPDVATRKTKVGDASHQNRELIVSLRPDMVCTISTARRGIGTYLEQRGVTIFTLAPGNLVELYQGIKAAGALVHREENAAQLVSSMKRKIQAVTVRAQRLSENRNPPSIMILVSQEPVMIAGPQSFQGELVRLLGCENLEVGTDRPYCTVNREFILQQDPDIIIGMYGKRLDESFNADFLQALTAVRKGHVYHDIDPALLYRPGPRVVQGLELLLEKVERYFNVH